MKDHRVCLVCSRTKRAEWEDDQEYCEGVKHQPPFDEGRVLIDLIDLHIFDYVQGRYSLGLRHIRRLLWHSYQCEVKLKAA